MGRGDAAHDGSSAAYPFPPSTLSEAFCN